MKTMNLKLLGRAARRGVTLIEILIVLAIVGLIAGGVAVVAVPKYQEAQKKQAQTDARTIHPAAEKYRVDHPGEGCPTVELLRDKNELRFRYSLNGAGDRSIHAHTIIVGNCGALPANIMLLPDAAVDDGQFDVLLLRPEGFVGWVKIFVKVLWENGVLRRTKAGRVLMTKEISALRYVKARELSVALERAEEIELDGDGFGTATGFRSWVDEGGIAIRVPAE